MLIMYILYEGEGYIIYIYIYITINSASLSLSLAYKPLENRQHFLNKTCT